jgi:hypothetical protein
MGKTTATIECTTRIAKARSIEGNSIVLLEKATVEDIPIRSPVIVLSEASDNNGSIDHYI